MDKALHLTNEQLQALFNVVDKSNSPTARRDRVLIYTFYYSGLRSSDVSRLRKDNLNFNEKVIVIKEEKTDKVARIPMSSKLYDILEPYCRNLRRNDYLFQSRIGNNKPLGRTMVFKILTALGRLIGLERLSPHSLRKTFGRNLYKRSNNNIGLVQKVLRHSTSAITLDYIGVTDEFIKDSIELL